MSGIDAAIPFCWFCAFSTHWISLFDQSAPGVMILSGIGERVTG